jgi:hypothetical protein
MDVYRIKYIIIKLALLLAIFIVSSCWGTKDYDKKYLYDQVGFKGNDRPIRTNYQSNQDSQKVNKRNTIPPEQNYYYGYGSVPPSMPAVAPVQIRPQASTPQRAVSTFNGGGSRFYSNPYAIPAAQVPQGYYPNAYAGYTVYDADRFYVPPNSYRYIEKSNNPRNTQEFNGDACNFGC